MLYSTAERSEHTLRERECVIPPQTKQRHIALHITALCCGTVGLPRASRTSIAAVALSLLQLSLLSEHLALFLQFSWQLTALLL